MLEKISACKASCKLTHHDMETKKDSVINSESFITFIAKDDGTATFCVCGLESEGLVEAMDIICRSVYGILLADLVAPTVLRGFANALAGCADDAYRLAEDVLAEMKGEIDDGQGLN